MISAVLLFHISVHTLYSYSGQFEIFSGNDNSSVAAVLFWDLMLQDVICDIIIYFWIYNVSIYTHMYKILNNQEFYVGTGLYNLFCFYDPIKKMLFTFHKNDFR